VNVSFWADISLIWLSLFCFVGLLIPLAAGYFAVRGMNAAIRGLRPLLLKAQGVSSLTKTKTAFYADRAVAPVIKAQRSWTRFESAVRRLWPG
jgi:hypothetical protein